MSDTHDWTGVSAGAVTVLASGSANAFDLQGQTSFQIAISAVPATVRSVLLLVLPTFVSNTTTAYILAKLTGTTTKQVWRPLGTAGTWLNANGGTVPVGGTAMVPLYFPAYGITDPDMNLVWTVNGGQATDAIDYWVLGMPDPDLLGSSVIPAAVINAEDGTSQNTVPLNVTANEAPYSASTGAVVNLTNVVAGIVPAPAAGFTRVVSVLAFYSASGVIDVNLDTGGITIFQVQVSNTMNPPTLILPGPIKLTTNPLNGATVSGTCEVSALWTDYR